jgi:hypothetical protein
VTWFKLLVLSLPIVITAMPRPASAAQPVIPASVYPSGAHITYRPVVSNADLDCLWGFFCDGNVPLFHFQTEDQLHRSGGWAQFAGVPRGRHTRMAFELFVSAYGATDSAGAPWSERAFLDLRAALHDHDYHPAHRASGLLPAVRDGGTFVVVERSGSRDLAVMAYWAGSLEIEGIVMYAHGSAAARQVAWSSLALQIRVAADRGV